MPAQAGIFSKVIQIYNGTPDIDLSGVFYCRFNISLCEWIPACAGMTGLCAFVIPAKAGIHTYSCSEPAYHTPIPYFSEMLKPKHQYAVYIMTNKKNGTLYVGMSGNLEVRVYQHKQKLVEGFTKKYDITRLVYFEIYQYVINAIKREKNIKAWKRQWKINLIEQDNPNWDDLAEDWEL